MGKQHDTVRHIAFQLQRQGSAIDEGIPVGKHGTVIQNLFSPVQCLISHQGGTADREEEYLRRVGQELQVITALGRKLGPWNGSPAITVVLQQVFHASHPMVGPFRIARHGKPRVPVNRRLQASGKATPEFHALHSGKVTLGVCLPR